MIQQNIPEITPLSEMRLENLQEEKEELRQKILSENNNFSLDFGVSNNIFLKILNRFQQIIKENIISADIDYISISKNEDSILLNLYSKTQEMIQHFRISGKKCLIVLYFPMNIILNIRKIEHPRISDTVIWTGDVLKISNETEDYDIENFITIHNLPNNKDLFDFIFNELLKEINEELLERYITIINLLNNQIKDINEQIIKRKKNNKNS